MTHQELREQLQKDILTYLEDSYNTITYTEDLLSTVSQIIVDSFDEYECENKVGDYEIKT